MDEELRSTVAEREQAQIAMMRERDDLTSAMESLKGKDGEVEFLTREKADLRQDLLVAEEQLSTTTKKLRESEEKVLRLEDRAETLLRKDRRLQLSTATAPAAILHHRQNDERRTVCA